ncbi:hypothetical protein MVEN_00792600 [Mycena venus]|uniref:DUF6534 domain-containing protein n=1 Tax=Mycena venus TaxID=2733690 RepID=A0A8H7D6F7_9AGAR|nr:hypothetical protein MVEN_00792600 [Mycena venus]
MTTPSVAVQYEVGQWLIGSSIELVVQGVLSTQFVKYFGTSRDDSLALKMFVGGLALLTYAISIHTFTIVWYICVEDFGTVLVPQPKSGGIWLLGLSAVLRAIVGLYVQSYFCWRLFLISRKFYIVAIIAIIFITAFAANVVAVSCYISNGVAQIRTVEKWFNIYLPLCMAGDIALTTSTAYFLIKCRKNVLPQSVGTLNALIRLTFQTAAPATIFALINFFFSLAYPHVYPGARAAASTPWNIVLPKLYAFSMMWTLNARESIRAGLKSTHTGSDFMAASNAGNAGERTMVGDAELGSGEGKLKTSTEPCAPRKSGADFGEPSKKRVHVVGNRHGDAVSGTVGAEESDEELVFACPKNARGSV